MFVTCWKNSLKVEWPSLTAKIEKRKKKFYGSVTGKTSELIPNPISKLFLTS